MLEHRIRGAAAPIRGPASAADTAAGRDAAAPLRWREKLAYGVADMGFNFYWTNVATFLLIFYTDTFGISAAAAAAMMSTVKIVNAFTDPMIGAAADRTATRFGKFRPWLVWMSIPLAGAAVLTYTTPNLEGDAKLAWAYGTYLLMMVCYTCVNIPYNALSGVMSADPQERSTINGLRFIFAFAGSTLVTAATPSLVRLLGGGDDARGWQLAMLAWGLAATVLFLLTFGGTRERVAPPPGQRSNVLRDVRDLAVNRPWIVLFVLSLVIMVTITLRTASAAYYFKYVVGRPELMAAFVPTYMIAAAIGAACTPLLTRFADKKTLMIALMSLTALLSAAFYVVPADQVQLMFALQALLGLVLGPKSPLAFAMLADTADYNEWRTGRRATAMTFAAATFAQKLGTAMAVATIGSVFTALGYVPNAVQSGGSQAGIVWLMSLIPAGFALVAVLVMCLYNLDAPGIARMQAELAARKDPSA
ncbi:MFS transporter [Massilia sp. YIM B02763]|uniref:MFS transporter n=1 Tax=Massilia sp. YIM B02763 TaxID=3050130 RepID=UPI0025B7231F|nr:MFS transporter [Massilia sp. YIM B02763]MDN4051487.1 MFS transporter [Massilia sp. YIM B02763]